MKYKKCLTLMAKITSLIYTFMICIVDDNVKIGKGSLIYFRSKISNKSSEGHVIIGNNSKIGCSRNGFHAGMPFYTTVLNDGNNSCIEIGDNCRINGAYIHAQKKIVIRNNCVISSNVNILDSNGHEIASLDRTVGRDEPKEIIMYG